MEENIPLEIIEEILMNLPSKSLGRFSAVSKEWKAMISDKKFIRRHQIRGSLPGRERILLSHSPRSLMPATTCLLSSTSWNNRSPFICPLKNVKIVVSCSDMWCVENLECLGTFFVLNPSMGTYKKLPPPLFYPPWESIGTNFFYGMGFDSVADDYKILKVPRSEVYSLRSDSWRMIDQPYPMRRYPYHRNGVFVSNALHWMTHDGADTSTIISFDFSTEKYADFVQPPLAPREIGVLTVLRGKLCVYVNGKRRFVLWEMQEYGDGKSWTKIVDTVRRRKTILTPLYLYQNGMMLMKSTTAKGASICIFLVTYNYKDQRQTVWRGCDCGTSILYVETLVSPATY